MGRPEIEPSSRIETEYDKKLANFLRNDEQISKSNFSSKFFFFANFYGKKMLILFSLFLFCSNFETNV